MNNEIVPQAQEDAENTRKMLETVVNPLAKKINVQIEFDGNDAIRQFLHAAGYNTFSMYDAKHVLVYLGCFAAGALGAVSTLAMTIPSFLW